MAMLYNMNMIDDSAAPVKRLERLRPGMAAAVLAAVAGFAVSRERDRV